MHFTLVLTTGVNNAQINEQVTRHSCLPLHGCELTEMYSKMSLGEGDTEMVGITQFVVV